MLCHLNPSHAEMCWKMLLRIQCDSMNLNTLRPGQNGRHLKCIFLNENIWIPIKISLKFVPKGSINNIPALVQIMAWRRPGDKPLSEPMMVNLPTHICVTQPQWVNRYLAKAELSLTWKWMNRALVTCTWKNTRVCFTKEIEIQWQFS